MLFTIFLCLFLYVFCTKILIPTFYWQRRGVFHKKPWLRFLRIFILSKKSFAEHIKEAYDEYPQRRYSYILYFLSEIVNCSFKLDILEVINFLRQHYSYAIWI